MAFFETYLVTNCEKCGKQYGTTPEKLNRNEVNFTCEDCGTIINAIHSKRLDVNVEKTKVRSNPDRITGKSTGSQIKAGLTSKFMLFIILPLILISVAVIIISDNRMRNLQRQTINASTAVVQNISENLIFQISETVSRQVRQYLFSHPDLYKENFNRDIYFKKVVLQKIGITGSTSLYETSGDKGVWLTWADIEPTMVGQDLSKTKIQLGSHFQAYWDIITGVKSGKVSKGTYKWLDKKGNLRDKFMVCTPIEGTPYVISASIFLDEITAPLKKIETKGFEVAGQIRITLIVILGCGLLLIFLILLFYGRSLTLRIKHLANWADDISMGEMGTKPVTIQSKDEIGELTEAISRMQESIRLALDRIKTRRA